MKNLFYITFLSLIVISSCREQMVMIPEIDVIETERVILLEELTGVNCPNCPAGALQAKEILANFPGQVVVVAVHGDFLSEPLSNSQYDFRFEEAKDLENYLKDWFGKPAAAINRVPLTDSEFSSSSPALWPGFVETELSKEHVLDLVADVTYDATDRSVDVSIAAVPKINLEGDYNVTVMLTENDIIDAQLDQGEIIDAYQHEHVLRAFATPFDGTSLGSDLTEGEIINKNLNTTLPAEDGTWIAENMEVVVLVHRVDAGNKEVMQAFSTHLTE